MPIFEARVRVSYGSKALIEPITPQNENIHPTHSNSGLSLESAQLADIRRKVGTVVCGDYVTCEQSEQSTVITRVQERRSTLARPDRRRRMKPIAANLDQLVIVSAHKPGLDFALIDSYLVSARLMNIGAVLIFNKSDIEHNAQKLKNKIEYYQSLGIHSLSISLYKKQGIDALTEVLKSTTSLFVGQSGVGKSSIINTLIPDQEIQVGALSAATGLGSHTTTTTILYHLPHSGHLVDSPGVREFATWQHSEEDIAKGFIEIDKRRHLCKFNNCRHTQEPHCAVKVAVESGEIAPWRYEHYLNMIENSAHEDVLTD